MSTQAYIRPCAAFVALFLAGTASSAENVQPELPNLSIERIASAPFPSQLVAAPAREHVAWIFNDRGARNVWIAEVDEAGHVCSRRVTNYSGDQGLDIADLAWSGDGRSLVYVRGGDEDGSIAVNPLSKATGPEPGAVYAVAIKGGKPRLIGEGSDPLSTPRGDAVIFIRRGQPFIAPINGGAPVPLWTDRGSVGEMSWSPDGSKMAFVSHRAQHALIGVYDVAGKSISWMSPNIDIDREPVWSPDGRRLAFIRTPNDGLGVSRYISSRKGYPWEIWIAQVGTGHGERIWRANAGTGSRFRELFNSQHSLFWMADNRLYFPWEATGWVRLYALPIIGGEPVLLTPGQAEIFGAVQNADRTQLIFSSNHSDLNSRHIWSVGIDHGLPRQLTDGQGIEDIPAVTNGGHVFVLRADARFPLRPALVDPKSLIDIADQAIPKDFPNKDLIIPEIVSFKAADGMVIHGQLFVPKNRMKRGPALLFFHGGPTNRQMFAAWDPFETHTHLYEANQYLASHGYEVLSVNYRGGSGYGLDYREPANFGAGGASELNDIVGAAEYMRARPDVDPDKLGVWGGSYGGRMAALALSAAPKYFATGVDLAGIYDWTSMPGFTGDPAAQELARASSAIGHMQTWRAPVLLMQADADPVVPFEQTAALSEALRERGIPFESLMIPDEVHFLLRHQSWITITNVMRQYLDRYLK